MNNLNISVERLLERWYDEIKPAMTPNLAVCCKECYDTKFRLYVLTEGVFKNGKYQSAGTGYCHKCSRSYSIAELYAKYENVSLREAYEQLYAEEPETIYGKADKVLEEYVGKTKESKENVFSPPQIPKPYIRLFGLSETEWKVITPQYMQDRKITQEMCEEYRLGYCPAGGKWKDRMIIPIYQDGKLVAFQGRIMYPCEKQKYIFNTGASMGSYLYNLDSVPTEFKSVILTEGVFDVWGVKRAGLPNVVCSFGKHLSEVGRSKLIKRFKRVYVMWDADAKAEIAKLAEEINGIIEVYTCKLEDKDPDEATSDSVLQAILNAKPYSVADRMDALLAYK